MDYKHAVFIDAVDCDPSKDCTVQVSFKVNLFPFPGGEVDPYAQSRQFSNSCREGVDYCHCIGTDFCSKEVKLQINSKQYDGIVTDVPVNGSYAVVKLSGTRDIANILQGDGLIYGNGEIPAPLPLASAAASKASNRK